MADDTFTVRRIYRAPRELVFACMTEPEHLTHFWGPTGTSTPLEGIVVELRPGGAFETTMVNDVVNYVDGDGLRAAVTRGALRVGDGGAVPQQLTTVVDEAGEGAQQARLADPGLAPQQHRPAGAGQHAFPGLLQPREIGQPVDEGVGAGEAPALAAAAHAHPGPRCRAPRCRRAR